MLKITPDIVDRIMPKNMKAVEGSQEFDMTLM